jgi:predicted MFS family arabinose efflux permease
VRHPLVPVAVLRRRTVAVGNLAGLIAFATETGLVFLLTLYLQRELGYSPLGAGLAFAVLGAGTVIGGVLAPRVIGATSARAAIAGGLLAQAAATAPLVLLGGSPGWIALVLVATFAGGIANLVAIVGFMVAATSGLPDGEQGLATGLATMSQQVGITLGIPVLSAIATARSLTGAIAVDAAVCLVAAVIIFAHGRADARQARAGHPARAVL